MVDGSARCSSAPTTRSPPSIGGTTASVRRSSSPANFGRRPSAGPGRRVLEHARGRGWHAHARRRRPGDPAGASPVSRSHQSNTPPRGVSLGPGRAVQECPARVVGGGAEAARNWKHTPRTSWRPRAGCSSPRSGTVDARNGAPGITNKESRQRHPVDAALVEGIKKAIELPLESQRRVALQATVGGAGGPAARSTPLRVVDTRFKHGPASLVVVSRIGTPPAGASARARAAGGRTADVLTTSTAGSAIATRRSRNWRRWSTRRRPTMEPRRSAQMRLDHVLAQTTGAAGAPRSGARASRYGSDHYPLVAVIDAKWDRSIR